uniref:SF3 helicase domain-containing protein n=1 Tax=viral metagenome TaxID=1070528 RepID=A0A6C0CIW9_9ZZZZ
MNDSDDEVTHLEGLNRMIDLAESDNENDFEYTPQHSLTTSTPTTAAAAAGVNTVNLSIVDDAEKDFQNECDKYQLSKYNNIMEGAQVLYSVQDSSSIDEIDTEYNKKILKLTQAYYKLLSDRSIPAGQLSKYELMLYKSCRIATQVKNIIVETIKIKQTNQITFNPFNTKKLLDFDEYTPINKQVLNDYQKLLIGMLDLLYKKEHKRYKSSCYTQIYTPDGHATHAWEVKCSIREFIYSNTSSYKNFDMWNIRTKTRCVEQLEKELTECYDFKFKDLVKDRHAFSFTNGVYIAYDEETKMDKFLPYSEGQIPDDLVTAKYFDKPFDNFDHVDTTANNWYNAIPTPSLQKIMDDQKLPEDACKWMYVFIGRMLYWLNELEKWQVMMFIKGQAGTGKGMIGLNVIKMFYHPDDVGIASNNIERQFGISMFSDRFVWIAPEVRSDFQMEQGQFQNVVVGEDVSASVKHKNAIQEVWRLPGAMMGNMTPAYEDNSGSIARRIVLWLHKYVIAKGDTTLGDKLKDEMPRIIKKCNCAYLSAVRKVGEDSIWMHLPAYFHKNRELMQQETNAFINFLNSDKVVFGKDKKCLAQDLTEAYYIHTRDLGLQRQAWTLDLISGPFQIRGIFSENAKFTHPFTKMPRVGVWYIGIGLSNSYYTGSAKFSSYSGNIDDIDNMEISDEESESGN